MISDLSDDGMAVEGEFWVCLIVGKLEHHLMLYTKFVECRYDYCSPIQ